MISDVLLGIGGEGGGAQMQTNSSVRWDFRPFTPIHSGTSGLLRSLFMILNISSCSLDQKWQAKMVKRSLQEHKHTVALVDV